MQFYTNAFRYKGKLLIRGINGGRPFKKEVRYRPYLFVPSKNNDTKYKTIFDEPVDKIEFDSMWEAKNYLIEFEDVEGFKIYGSNAWVYNYINDEYPEQIEYDPTQICVATLDIENKIGKESISNSIRYTNNEITAISVSIFGHITAFGCKPYEVEDDNVTYIHCKDEKDLLRRFLKFWESRHPDVITGWNVEFYDIPYLVNRIKKLLGDDEALKLSPWGMVEPYEIDKHGKKQLSYDIKGINVLDYIALYRKFTYVERESYKLDHIAKVELNEKKLDYTEYSGLNDLYERNFQLFLSYTIHDVRLVSKLEDKMKLIELVFTIAYDAKVNYNDTLSTVRQWECIIHNYLMSQGKVVPQKKIKGGLIDFVGGYVKDVTPGAYNWVVSFDLDSLYPKLFEQYNISPETFVERLGSFPSIDEILAGGYKNNTNYSITANGCVYRKDKRGFLPALVEKIYAERLIYKNQLIEAKKEYEKDNNPQILKEISRLGNLQMARKIQLNSMYGACANRYFLWYDLNNAEAITTSGQLSIRWVSQWVNDYLNKTLKTDKIDFTCANDTDSCFFSLDKFISKVLPNEIDKKKIYRLVEKFSGNEIHDQIHKAYDTLANVMGCYEQKMNMKRECIADRGIWIAKKRYILNVLNQEGVEYKEPKLKITGIEAIQSSTPEVCREAIKDCLKVIMAGTEPEVQEYIREFKDRFKRMSFSEIAFPTGVTDVSKYETTSGFLKGTPAHVKGAVTYNRLLKKYDLVGENELITNGDKIKWSYLMVPNPVMTTTIASSGDLPKQFGLNEYLDRDVQFEKAFIKPLNSILKVIGWSPEEKSSLESFFS